jgi:hypothetical protein
VSTRMPESGQWSPYVQQTPHAPLRCLADAKWAAMPAQSRASRDGAQATGAAPAINSSQRGQPAVLRPNTGPPHVWAVVRVVLVDQAMTASNRLSGRRATRELVAGARLLLSSGLARLTPESNGVSAMLGGLVSPMLITRFERVQPLTPWPRVVQPREA